MSRPARVLAVAGMVAALAGCEATRSETSFDDALIRELGGGSVALQRIATTLSSDEFRGPTSDPTAAALLRGELDRLTEADLREAERTNRAARRRSTRLLRELNIITAELASARVDVREHEDLTDGAQAFLGAWNDYLRANERRNDRLVSAIEETSPSFAAYRRLIDAARTALRLRSADAYLRVRQDVVQDIVGQVESLQAALREAGSLDAADRRFVELVNEDVEAQAILVEVNERYPDGYLAQIAEDK